MDDTEGTVKRTSGRGAPKDDAVPSTGSRPSAGSNRVAPAAKPSGSGVRVAANVKPSGSGVRKVEAAPPPPPPAPAASSRRGAPAIKKKKQPLPIKEMAIAGAFVLVLSVVAIVIWLVKSREQTNVRTQAEIQAKLFEDNIQRAKDAMDKAAKAGTLFVIGKTDGTFDEKTLLAPFSSDPKIFNVIFDKGFKDKKGNEKHDVKKLKEDPEHTVISTISNKGKEIPPDLSINYGFAKGKEMPVVIAKKIIKPNAGDVVNTGGVIIVVVQAEEDEFFKRAKVYEAPKPDAPAADTKAGEKSDKAPAK